MRPNAPHMFDEAYDLVMDALDSLAKAAAISPSSTGDADPGSAVTAVVALAAGYRRSGLAARRKQAERLSEML